LFNWQALERLARQKAIQQSDAMALEKVHEQMDRWVHAQCSDYLAIDVPIILK
jgi:hypothetical protein